MVTAGAGRSAPRTARRAARTRRSPSCAARCGRSSACTGVHVGADVAERVPDVQPGAARVREHVEHVELAAVGDRGRSRRPAGPVGFGAQNVRSRLPAVLPLRLDRVGEARRCSGTRARRARSRAASVTAGETYRAGIRRPALVPWPFPRGCSSVGRALPWHSELEPHGPVLGQRGLEHRPGPSRVHSGVTPDGVPRFLTSRSRHGRVARASSGTSDISGWCRHAACLRHSPGPPLGHGGPLPRGIPMLSTEPGFICFRLSKLEA